MPWEPWTNYEQLQEENQRIIAEANKLAFGEDIPPTVEDLQKLTPAQRLVTYLTRDWLADKHYRTFEQYQEKGLIPTNPVEINSLLSEIAPILKKRTLPPFSAEPSEGIDPKFIAACNVLGDVLDKRSMAKKLQDVSMTTTEFKNLMRDPNNRDFYHRTMGRLFDEDVFEAGRLALARNVADGDLHSIRYFNEMAGYYKQTNEFDPRIIVEIVRMMVEIVSKHVDASVAAKVADEIDKAAIQSLQLGTGD